MVLLYREGFFLIVTFRLGGFLRTVLGRTLNLLDCAASWENGVTSKFIDVSANRDLARMPGVGGFDF